MRCAPRSYGTLNDLVAVIPPPPISFAASRRKKRLPDAASRRPAAIPAAPAPIMITSTLPERGVSGGGLRGAAHAGPLPRDAHAARNKRRVHPGKASAGLGHAIDASATPSSRIDGELQWGSIAFVNLFVIELHDGCPHGSVSFADDPQRLGVKFQAHQAQISDFGINPNAVGAFGEIGHRLGNVLACLLCKRH